MAIKSILVPLVGGSIDEVALHSAVVVAKQFDAHVEGLHIRVSADEASNFFNNRLDTALYAEVLENLRIQITQEEQEVRKRFEELIERSGLGLESEPSKATGPSASWRSIAGDPIAIIARSRRAIGPRRIWGVMVSAIFDIGGPRRNSEQSPLTTWSQVVPISRQLMSIGCAFSISRRVGTRSLSRC